MRAWAWTGRAVVVLALLGAVGCGDERRSESPDPSAAKARQELEEAADATADYVAAQRRELAAQAQRAADQVAEELLSAREQLAALPEQARGPLEHAIARTEEARQSLAAQLEALKQSGAEQWARTREGVEAALGDLADARRELGAVLVEDDQASSSPESS